MNLDWTLNVGNVVSLAVLIVAIYRIRDTKHQENIARFDAIEKQLDEMRQPWKLMWAWFRKEHGISNDDL